jgi:ADP-ribose pyrophosphatase YjhB (NUDIX family)
MRGLPRFQRVAAYAVIIRDGKILLSRISARITPGEMWTLPGGGLVHGEDPRDAVVREVREETGLDATIGETARVYSAHLPGVRREGRRVDAHAIRIVYEGWVPADAPEPRVVEIGGSTVAAGWHPVDAVWDGTVHASPTVLEALADHRTARHQRLAAYALVLRPADSAGAGDSPAGEPCGVSGAREAGEVLLVRVSARGFHTGSWTLPGGGVGHGESLRDAALRELREETGLGGSAGELVAVHEEHFSGTAPSGRFEDFHSVGLVFEVTADAGPVAVAETDGTTDAVAWVPVAGVLAGEPPVLDLVRVALEARKARLMASAGRFTGSYPADYLEELREGWPE